MRRFLFLLNLLRTLLVGIIFRLAELVGQVFPETDLGCRIRGLIYRPFLLRAGKNFQVGLQARLEHLDRIAVGDDVYIGHGSWISGLNGGIVLEDQVMLGPYVVMISSNHKSLNGSFRFGEGADGAIKIGYGTWVAAGASILAGTTIGSSCLIAAGAVVNEDIPDRIIAGGVPARQIGRTDDVVD